MEEDFTWHANPVWLVLPYLQNLADDLGTDVDWDAVQAAADYCESREI